jgi:hypothetical protein
MSVNEGANANDKMVKTSNLLAPHQEESPSETILHEPLTFDPSPPLEEGEDTELAVFNEKAELMQWHHRLSHLGFPKLKQLALNGKIPKKLANVAPPKCDGCLFGAMTKILWHCKETKASNKVFITTKPGECVYVDQMLLTEVGFYAQLKGKLTKKRYKGATIILDHFSRQCFVHL